MGTRQFQTKNSQHCTVFAYLGESVLDQLGEGTIESSGPEYENNALVDQETDFESGPGTYYIDMEIACESDDTSWFTRRGGSGALQVTTANETLTGTFGVINVRKSLNSAVRWNVRLRNKGAVTVA